MKCPHCKIKAFIRSSEALSELTRKQYYQCSNVFCGHTFTAMQSISETIVPSQCLDPKIKIPLSQNVRSFKEHAINENIEINLLC